MDCNQALEAISAALDDELTQRELTELDAHLAVCPECRTLADDFGVLSVALSDMEEAAPPALLEQVRAAVPEGTVPLADARDKRRKRAWLPMAAMLAVVVSLGGVYIHLSGMDGGAGFNATAQFAATNDEAMAGGSVSASQSPESALAKSADDAPSSAPANSSAPSVMMMVPESETAQADGTQSESETVEPGVPALAAAATPITPEEALTLVFDYLGGAEAYPDAVLFRQAEPDGPGYDLKTVENKDGLYTYRLTYDGLSANEAYHVFRYDQDVQDLGTDGLDRTAASNHFAVSLDGSTILAEFDPDSDYDSLAYYEATGS